MQINGPDGLEYIEVTTVKLIPRDAVDEYKAICRAAAATLTEGARAGRTSIREYGWRKHLTHAVQHINSVVAGLADEPHFQHALTRVGLAMCAKRREEVRHAESARRNDGDFARSGMASPPSRRAI